MQHFYEESVSAKVAMEQETYTRLGLTDAVIMSLQKEGAALFSADLDLILAAQQAGFEATNYNWLRDGAI